jgi:diaminopropionate ammonia-lyase
VTGTRPWGVNPDADRWTAPDAGHTAVVAEFHRSLPGYRPAPLVGVPSLAARLGVRSVAVKDESDRLGLPAFKALGASWAVNRAISARLGVPPARAFAELVARASGTGLTLVTATDGNHGRAVARVARLLGLAARVYVPEDLTARTLAAIEGEGAVLVRTDLHYDEAVGRAAAGTAGRPADLLVQDTAWPGYEEVPGWIVEGYATLFAEIDAQHAGRVDLVVVPTGVGSLLQAAIGHYRAATRAHRPALLAVEPVTAACVTRSLRAGAPVTVDTTSPTVMAGLNCGTVSSIAWPAIRDGLDAGVGVTDGEALDACAVLHRAGVAAGPCGAAALAGAEAAAALPELSALLATSHSLRALRTPPAGCEEAEGVRSRADVDVLLISTEASAGEPARGQ